MQGAPYLPSESATFSLTDTTTKSKSSPSLVHLPLSPSQSLPIQDMVQTLDLYPIPRSPIFKRNHSYHPHGSPPLSSNPSISFSPPPSPPPRNPFGSPKPKQNGLWSTFTSFTTPLYGVHSSMASFDLEELSEQDRIKLTLKENEVTQEKARRATKAFDLAWKRQSKRTPSSKGPNSKNPFTTPQTPRTPTVSTPFNFNPKSTLMATPQLFTTIKADFKSHDSNEFESKNGNGNTGDEGSLEWPLFSKKENTEPNRDPSTTTTTTTTTITTTAAADATSKAATAAKSTLAQSSTNNSRRLPLRENRKIHFQRNHVNFSLDEGFLDSSIFERKSRSTSPRKFGHRHHHSHLSLSPHPELRYSSGLKEFDGVDFHQKRSLLDSIPQRPFQILPKRVPFYYPSLLDAPARAPKTPSRLLLPSDSILNSPTYIQQSLQSQITKLQSQIQSLQSSLSSSSRKFSMAQNSHSSQVTSYQTQIRVQEELLESRNQRLKTFETLWDGKEERVKKSIAGQIESSFNEEHQRRIKAEARIKELELEVLSVTKVVHPSNSQTLPPPSISPSPHALSISSVEHLTTRYNKMRLRIIGVAQVLGLPPPSSSSNPTFDSPSLAFSPPPPPLPSSTSSPSPSDPAFNPLPPRLTLTSTLQWITRQLLKTQKTFMELQSSISKQRSLMSRLNFELSGLQLRKNELERDVRVLEKLYPPRPNGRMETPADRKEGYLDFEVQEIEEKSRIDSHSNVIQGEGTLEKKKDSYIMSEGQKKRILTQLLEKVSA